MNNGLVENKVALEAERQLLGSIIIEPDIISDIKGVLYPGDFIGGKESQHGRIYAAMVKCHHPDIVSVSYKMVETDYIDDDDIYEMRQCYAECMTSMDYVYYRDAVLGYSVRRYSKYYLDNGEPERAQRILNRLTARVRGGVVLKRSNNLPDCPECGLNEWTYSADGKLQCPCGYVDA